MIDITQNDFSNMQAQAIRYARELQKRAVPQRAPEPPRNLQNPPTPKQSFPDPNDIFGHRNPWTQKQETPFCKSACPIKNLLGIGNGSQSDGDILLLMALLLILTSDGGDRMLMLALLYIMS